MGLSEHEEHLRLLGRGEPGEILELLLKVSQKPQAKLQFFNHYKEVPVYAQAELLYLFDDTLACRTNETQTQAIKNSRYTIIRSPELPQDLYASAQYNQQTNEIILSDFAYVEVLPDRRGALRVRIGGLFRITVEAGADQFNGKLKDLSLGGCAVEIPDKNLLGSFSYFHLNFLFDLKNRPQPQPLRILSRLLRCEEEQSAVRCIFIFEHDLRSEDLIGMYIAQRQAEIIKELKQ